LDEKRDNRPALIFIGAVLAAALVAGVIVLASGGDEGDEGSASTGLPEGCTEVPAAKAKDVTLAPPPGGKQPPEDTSVTVQTSCGDFEIELDPDSPKTAASFVHMAEQGAYDGTSINRIAPGFVIQGGDPTETQAGDAGYHVDEPPAADTVYSRGTVAMAKSGADPPGRSGSQFFVVTAPADAGLPPDYAVLGTVPEGDFGTIERIESVGTETGGDGPPKSPVVIEKITVN
jgi:cyclophilin family peptidyl-prolyl cis-trans isomerase